MAEMEGCPRFQAFQRHYFLQMVPCPHANGESGERDVLFSGSRSRVCLGSKYTMHRQPGWLNEPHEAKLGRKHPGILCWRKYARYNHMEDSQTVSIKVQMHKPFRSAMLHQVFPIYKDLHFSIICNSKKDGNCHQHRAVVKYIGWQIHTMVY